MKFGASLATVDRSVKTMWCEGRDLEFFLIGTIAVVVGSTAVHVLFHWLMKWGILTARAEDDEE